MEKTITGERDTSPDYVLALATYGVTGAIFAPLLYWFAQRTSNSEQLTQALIILVSLGAFLAWENREKLQPRFRHDRLSLILFLASWACLGAQWLFHITPLALVALILSVAGLLRFTFGARASVATRPILIAFGVFTVLATLLPLFDWPLRMLAGKWSAAILQHFGGQIELLLVSHQAPQLVLRYDARPFVVAPECNGFGLLCSSLLVALMLCTYKRLRWLDYTLMLVAAIVLAVAANLLRIVIIVLLAPHVSDYHLMHEIVGVILFYATLCLIGWLCWATPRKAAANPAPIQAS